MNAFSFISAIKKKWLCHIFICLEFLVVNLPYCQHVGKCIMYHANPSSHTCTHTHTVYTLGIIDLCLRYYNWYRWSSNTCGIIFAIVMGPINVNSDHRCYKFGVMTHAMNTSSCELYIYATPLNIKQHGLANEAKTLTEATFIYCTLYS